MLYVVYDIEKLKGWDMIKGVFLCSKARGVVVY